MEIVGGAEALRQGKSNAQEDLLLDVVSPADLFPARTPKD